MDIDKSTAFVIGLLVFAASLASYGLSVSLGSRRSRGLFITGLSIGTALLLAAAVIIVASTDSWLARHISPDAWTLDEAGNRASVSLPLPSFDTSRKPTASQASLTSNTPASAENHDDAGMHTLPSPSSSKSDAASAPTSGPPHGSNRAVFVDSGRVVSVPSTTHPWAATTCIIAIQPDPAEPTRWRLENECGAAVAILFSARESTSWTYPAHPMLLPAKHQRSVTYAEQTQFGEEIRYVACTLVSANVITLLGRGSEFPSARARSNEEDLRPSDDCLARTAYWAQIGRRSGASIDEMLGNGLPGRIRTAR